MRLDRGVQWSERGASVHGFSPASILPFSEAFRGSDDCLHFSRSIRKRYKMFDWESCVKTGWVTSTPTSGSSWANAVDPLFHAG
jgi:hypothetical protein